MIVTVTPNPSVDLTYAVGALVRGQLHRARVEPAEPSGKGINVTRALAGNGRDSTAVFPSGGATGETLRALLSDEGISFVAVPIAGAVRVNVAVVEPGGTATKFNAPGPTVTEAETARLLTATLESARRATWVVASGSLPPGVDAGFYAALSRHAHTIGARFALDTSGPSLLAGLAAGADVVKPNLEEVAESTGRSLRTLGDAAAAGNELRSRGAATVVVSAGAAGALLIDDRGVLHAEARVPAPASTVGAGDALLAGLLAGWEAHGRLGVEALAEAVAWASASLRLPGSRVPRITEADRRAVGATDRPELDRPLPHPVGPLPSSEVRGTS